MECYENVLFKGAWFNLFMYDQMHKINKKKLLNKSAWTECVVFKMYTL